jgi:acetyltransferase-like isoleucine patch superfamily enzyme
VRNYIAMEQFLSIAPSVKLGEGVKLSQFINLYGCSVGDHTKIGAFVEIQKNASVGANCKISSHTFICEGVQIEDDVFVGHGVTFINDSGATILSNVVIGKNAMVGAGSVVTKNVPPQSVVAGNPAKVLRFLNSEKKVK